MITYVENIKIKVLLEGRIIGMINKVDGGYQYFPKGSKKGGLVYKTLGQVKWSLENEED